MVILLLSPEPASPWSGNTGNQAIDCVSFLAEMRLTCAIRSGVLAAAICLCVRGQVPPTEAKGIPPRAAPSDYQAQAQAGTLTIAADFTGHSVPTLQGPLTTEDFVVVEAGLFGPPDAKIKISIGDFALRINGRQAPLPSQPYGMAVGSLKDPEWEPPEPAAAKSKSRVTGGGGGEQAEPGAPPVEVKIPIPVQRAMAQRVQKAALPEGDRVLPQAGLIFFQYRGKAQSIRSVELIYSGPAGKATLSLQP
jgi:hypothetical protein